MTTKITVVLLNWKRSENVKAIVQTLRNQSVSPQIFLWDNAQDHNRVVVKDVDWYIQSSLNKICWPRWFMASQADTQYVMSLDDDLNLLDDFVIEDLIAVLDNDCHAERIFGREGVILRPGMLYAGSNQHNEELVNLKRTDAVNVDIVKGRLMAFSKEALIHAPILTKVTNEDDIAISGLLAKGRNRYHRVLGWLQHRTYNLPDNDALYNQPGHFKRRDAGVKKYFPWHT